MECTTCGDEIHPESDTRYEEAIPIEGGGQTVNEFCSTACLNEHVEFTDEEIKSLMRQSGYEIPSKQNFEWSGSVVSEITDLVGHSGGDTGCFILLEHTSENYDVEVYRDPEERLFEVNLYEYEMEGDEKRGYVEVEKRKTGVLNRALKKAEILMEKVEDGKV